VDQIDGVLLAIPEAQDLGATVVLSPATWPCCGRPCRGGLPADQFTAGRTSRT
jgi:hypothetical protein